MSGTATANWKDRIVSASEALSAVKPGMSIFVGTGIAEPRTLVRQLKAAAGSNLQDLEIIQLMCLGDTIDESSADKYRVKTFHEGCVAGKAIASGLVDLIPSRFSQIPALFKSGAIHIDAAFIQITPPAENGYAALGVSVDVARHAMDGASLVIGEINGHIPRTCGDTLVHVDEFDYFVQSTTPPPCLARWPITDAHRQTAANISAIIDDGSCISFSIGPLFEALGQQLSRKRDLGVHTPFFTDALMDMAKAGAVSNRRKKFYTGISVASYALGTAGLLQWLDNNRAVEFHPLDVVMDFNNIARNDRHAAIIPVRKIDLTGGIAGVGAFRELIQGAALSEGGRTIFALTSRDRAGRSNIRLSVEDYPNHMSNRESRGIVATEYGIAHLEGKTIRERALSLIDIAHPDDRAALVQQAKEAKVLYGDQIYISNAALNCPDKIAASHVFRDGLTVRFRAIRPSDEEEMRRFFYRFSETSVYYRYFNPVKTMPHTRMQEYVNVDRGTAVSIVGIVEEAGGEHIVAEARYELYKNSAYADAALIVEEKYMGKGIATFMLNMLIGIAREQGGEGFLSYVIPENKAILKVARKTRFPVRITPAGECYEVLITFGR